MSAFTIYMLRLLLLMMMILLLLTNSRDCLLLPWPPAVLPPSICPYPTLSQISYPASTCVAISIRYICSCSHIITTAAVCCKLLYKPLHCTVHVTVGRCKCSTDQCWLPTACLGCDPCLIPPKPCPLERPQQ